MTFGRTVSVNHIPPATTEKKSNFCFPRKQPMILLDKELRWVNAKKAIQRDLGTFRQNQEYSKTLRISAILRAVVSPEP